MTKPKQLERNAIEAARKVVASFELLGTSKDVVQELFVRLQIGRGVVDLGEAIKAYDEEAKCLD